MTPTASTRLKHSYGSREVAAITGLTARQLQLWEAGGLMLPAMPTRRTAAGGYTERRYSPIDVLELRALAELRRHGFSIAQLHTLVRVLKEHFGVRLFEATGGGGSVRLLTDGRDIYARTSAGEFFNLLESPEQALLVAGDERLWKEVGGKARVKRRKKKGLR